MARISTSTRTMYGDPELDIDFEKVHDHYGRNYKVTEVLRTLVRDKAREIENGDTRRDQIKMMREDVDAMRQEIADLRGSVTTLIAAVARLEARSA